MKIERIPTISDRKLLKRMEKLTPLIAKYEEIKPLGLDAFKLPHYYLLEFENRIEYLRNTSFIWEPELGKKVWPRTEDSSGFGSRSPITIITYHSYGAPSLFKPSLAEVVAQLPKNFEGVFCIESKDLNNYNCLDDGYHFTKTHLWEKYELDITSVEDVSHQMSI